MSTMSTEIRLLCDARNTVAQGIPYICGCLLRAGQCIAAPAHIVQSLQDEVLEFLDDNLVVSGWLPNTSKDFQQTMRLAIIDTMLARRGVRLSRFIWRSTQ